MSASSVSSCRSYYRCVCFRTSTPCAAKKRVDRLLSDDADDSSTSATPPVSVLYINRHGDEADQRPCQRPGTPRDGMGGNAFAGMMRELEHMRAEDLAREMVSDLMTESGGHEGALCGHLGGATAGADNSDNTSLEALYDSMDQALASEAEELLSALLEGPRACSLQPTRSLESHNQRDAFGPQSFHQQHMDALAFLNQERLVNSAHALEIAPGGGLASCAGGASRIAHTLRTSGGNTWTPSAPTPKRPQHHHLPASHSRSSSNRGTGHSSRGQGWGALQPSFEAQSSTFVSAEDAEYMLECLKRGLEAGLV